MNRTTTLLFVVFLLLLGSLYFFLISKNPPVDTQAPVRMIPNFQAERVSKLFFEDLERGTRAVFQRLHATAWEMREPLVYPAEVSAINAILAPFQHNECIVLREIADPKSPALADYHLDMPRVVIELTLDGVLHRVLIGEEDVSGANVFVYADGKVLKTSKNVHNAIRRTISELRDKRIFYMPFSAVQEFALHKGEQVLSFARKKNQWWMKSPYAERADAPAVHFLLSSLLGLMVKDFHRDHPVKENFYALDPIVYRVILKGGGVEENLALGFNAGELMAFKEGVNFIWKMHDEVQKILDWDADLYRDHGFFQNYREQITEVRLGNPNAEIVFAKKNNAWSMIAPAEYPVEQSKIEDLLAALEQMSAEEFAPPADLAAYGLAAAARWIQVQYKGQEQPVKVWVGNRDEQGRWHVLRAGETTALLVAGEALPFMQAGVFDFVALAIFRLQENEVGKIEVQWNAAAPLQATWVRDEMNRWYRLAESADGEKPEDKEFNQKLDYFLIWKAERVVSNHPSDFSWDTPLLELNFYSQVGDGEDYRLRKSMQIIEHPQLGYLLRGEKSLVYSLDKQVVNTIKALVKQGPS